MKQFISLLKVQITSMFTFESKRNKGKKKRLNKTTKLLLMTIIYLGINGYMALYMLGMYKALSTVNLEALLPMAFMIFTSLILIINGFIKVKGTLYGFKDYTLLMSMPIKNSVIICSRISSLYIYNLVITVALMLPTILVYGILSSCSPLFYVLNIILMLITPFIPMVVSSIIGVIFGLLSERSRYSNLVSAILGLGFMVVIIGGSYLIPMNMEGAVITLDSIITSVGRYYPPAVWFFNASIQYNIISFIEFIALAIAIFSLFILLYSEIFKQLNSMFGEKYSKSNYKHSKLSVSSPIIALYKKELKRYFTSSIYLTNTLATLVLLTVASIALLIIKPEELLTLLEMPQFSDQLINLIPIGLALSVSMCYITACSISLEGNNLWILRMSPLSEKDIFLSKIMTNLTVTVPVIILNVILLNISLGFDVRTLLIQLIIPIGVSMFSSIAGLIINLKLPRLDYKNEVYVVKQSASAFFGMLIGFVPVGVYFIIWKVFDLNHWNGGTLVGILSILLMIFIGYSYLMTAGKKDFRNLTNN